VTDTTVTAQVNGPEPGEASRKARRSVMLALVHVALAVGVLALFVFVQSHKG
jgi:3-deoxy-D-manno-octulosonic acid (KDO) 8-phosphate synthase